MNMNNTFDILLHEINSSQCVLFEIILHFILEHCIRNLSVYKMVTDMSTLTNARHIRAI